MRKPTVADGPAITRLIAASAPLDVNSAYCNLLQCTHFADTCIVAERGGEILGWVSGYRPPSEPSSFFVWQVAIAREARGKGLARHMINALLDRPFAAGVTRLIATVTEDNAPSRALFNGLARAWRASLTRRAMFECDTHFAGAHATEWLVCIGPLQGRHFQTQDQEI
ncbi:Proteinase inhibitor I3, Kunitz legume [Nitrobacter sp. Nb-311A]|uniref:diaminobutyrate acetyltransferase n=1 Tax=unclassified Nitrobacter TaxID=2620411 RepID=UPI0000687FC5|nr:MULTISPECIES: diaminobutyrate acetyltransferase [unclassified Nitrobacter]EAQ36213.1 Proteinase inhibitor I3, Kunitz legume [Nitrobacter sp. Nb-311A]